MGLFGKGLTQFQTGLLKSVLEKEKLLLTLSEVTNFRLFQIERVCRRQFLIKMKKRSSKWLENTEGKGEIAHQEQFLLFPQCFQNTNTADT